MNSATRRNVGTTGRDTHVATVAIGLDGRHEALRLMAALTPFHSFVIQHDRAHWVVHARVPGCHDETLDDLLTTIERWESDTGVNDFTCVVNASTAAAKILSSSVGAFDDSLLVVSRRPRDGPLAG